MSSYTRLLYKVEKSSNLSAKCFCFCVDVIDEISFYPGNLAKLFSLDGLLQLLAPLPIGFAVFLVHLATIPITGTGINPARSLGAAIIYNRDHAWDDHVSFNTPFLFWLISWNLGANLHTSTVQVQPLINVSFLQWIFWVGPFVGAALAALYHQVVIRAIPFKSGNWNISSLIHQLLSCLSLFLFLFFWVSCISW